MRVDWHLRRAEDRRVNTGREGYAERIVRRHGDDARAWTNELVEVVRETSDDVVALEFAQQRLLNDAHTGGHVPRRTVGVVFDVTPLRILSINDAFHPDRY